MNQTVIAQAREVDVETVSSILQEAAEWLVAEGMPLWKADQLLPERIRADVTSGMFYLARVGEESAGCLRLQREDEFFWPDVPQGEAAYLHRLAVRRSFAGGGVSRAMIEWAKQRVRDEGRRYLRLDCIDRAKLRQVYERNGFRTHSECQIGPYWVVRYECDLTPEANSSARTAEPLP